MAQRVPPLVCLKEPRWRLSVEASSHCYPLPVRIFHGFPPRYHRKLSRSCVPADTALLARKEDCRDAKRESEDKD